MRFFYTFIPPYAMLMNITYINIYRILGANPLLLLKLLDKLISRFFPELILFLDSVFHYFFHMTPRSFSFLPSELLSALKIISLHF